MARSLGPDLEFARLGHVLDAFEWFVFLAVHVQAIYLQAFGTKGRETVCQRRVRTVQYVTMGTPV